MRYHADYHSSGEGHVYQGRFKSFPIQDDDQFLTVCRDVERNALQGNLVDRAEDWRWSSLFRRVSKPEPDPRLLAVWPTRRTPGWKDRVNAALTKGELEALENERKEGLQNGDEKWVTKEAKRLEIESTLRKRGRPRIRQES